MPVKSSFETQDWIASVQKIKVDDPSAAHFDAPVKPSDDDMGAQDPETVIYVNLRAKNLPSKFNDKIKDLTQMLQLTQQWLDIQAGIQANKRTADNTLPADSSKESKWKRSDFRIKVVDLFLTKHCAWIYNTSGQDYTKTINVKRVEFHLELLKNMLSGLLIPTSLAKTLEDVFKGLSDVVIQTQKTSEGRAVWVLFQIFTYDEVKDDLRASLRNISYALDQDMRTVIVNKNSYDSISVNFSYSKKDFGFNEATWAKVNPEITNFIDNLAIKQAREPLDVEISVDQ